MKIVYYSILLLTLYGDTLKRYVSAGTAVAVLYITALAILVGSALLGQKSPRSMNRTNKTLLPWLILIIFLYFFQLLIALGRGITFAAFSSALYICIPVLYCIVILKSNTRFDIIELAKKFHLLMLPINAVGLIQYYINPNFLISTNYSESGGIITRNILSGGSFLRFPSIFVSADRYSAIGLMQCYFAFIIWANSFDKKNRDRPLAATNFICGLVAILIAGARSRILIILALSLLFVLTSIKGWRRGATPSKLRNIVMRSVGIFFVSILALPFALLLDPDFFIKFANYPVIGFLIKSLHEGDVSNRIDESFSFSLIPENVSFWGAGLGSLGAKPGEFGIAAMWTEGGLLFGGLTLLTFIAIILTMASAAFKAFQKGDSVSVVSFSFPAFVLGFGLLTGLTGVLELSSGILLMLAIASSFKAGTTGYPQACQSLAHKARI